jgi:pilus assembly protein CpaB
MNTKRIIVLGFALVAASAAALLARSLMGGGTPKVEAKIGPPAVAMSEVLVAAANIQPGRALVPDMVRWQRWPVNAVDASFITHAIAPNLADALKNTVVRVPLYAGQPITNTAIVHADTAGFMSAQLQPGMRAVSIVISVESGAGGFILPNDRVDLMLTTKTNETPPQIKTKTILGDVRVLAVDQTFKEEKDTKTVVGKTATLELTPSQGELVAAAQNMGSVSLSLRGLGDDKAVASARSFNGEDGLVSIIRYGVMHSKDGDTTVQGAREKAQ